MADVYLINNDDGTTEGIPRIQCKNEDKELQSVLEKNLSLIPGDQICPDDGCRWLCIKREMPVPDPNTGGNRWSIDFFIVDQNARPTFVECKRFGDTRSRREIVGQVFEYAANAYDYWTKEDLISHAEATAEANGKKLIDALKLIKQSEDCEVEGFFEQIVENLREGQLRIVFYLEKSPLELKSMVDFLNRQMERTEVLLVEAQTFEINDKMRIVVPRLFGYTEEAKRAKRIVNKVTNSSRRKWDKETFLAEARGKNSIDIFDGISKVLVNCLSSDQKVNFGTGVKMGTFSFVLPTVCSRSIFTIDTTGSLSFNFGWVNGSDTAISFRKELKDKVDENLEIKIPEDYESRFVSFRAEEWIHKVPQFLKVISEISREYSM